MLISAQNGRTPGGATPAGPDALRALSHDVLGWLDMPFEALKNRDVTWFGGPEVRTSWHDQLAWFAPSRLERYLMLFREGITQDVARAAPQLHGEIAAAVQAAEGWCSLVAGLSHDTTQRPLGELLQDAHNVFADPGPEVSGIVQLAGALMNAAGGPGEATAVR